jgi:hypothetical protein
MLAACQRLETLALCAALALGCAAHGDLGPGGGVDGGAADAGVEDSDAAPPLAVAEVYPADRTLSPITPYVAARLREIAARGDLAADVFAKIGASATVSAHFLHCFAGEIIDLDGRDELEPTIAHFLGGDAAGTSPYERQSLSATVGWSAGAALAGDPSPLEQELFAIAPRFAVVMFGTNDIQQNNIDRYGDNMLELADRLIDAGVIPVFTTIMPRDDSAAADAQVPRYNLVVRAVAQSRQVPFIDFHRELVPLPDHGLGADGIHPSVYRDGGARPCVFSADGLAHGYNIRNLITIQTLDRLRRVVLEGEAAPDGATRVLAGSGAHDDPFVIDALPFTHVADTRQSPHREVDVYDGCGASQDESGAEYVYRLDVTEPTRVRIFVADRGDADVDLHLLRGGTGGDACIARHDRVLVADLEAGTYYLNVDSYVSGGVAREGEYALVVMAEP